PVVPFLCIAAGWATVAAVRAVAARVAADTVVARRIREAATVVVALVIVFPTAVKTVRLDRVLARTDTRVLAARALFDLIPPRSLVYHSGGEYGHVPFDLEGRQLDAVICTYDEAARRFTPYVPDWIILQRSPLVLYSDVPPDVEHIVRERDVLARSIAAESEARSGRIYDQQDAFFLPLDGFDGIERPGPAFEIYRRR